MSVFTRKMVEPKGAIFLVKQVPADNLTSLPRTHIQLGSKIWLFSKKKSWISSLDMPKSVPLNLKKKKVEFEY